MWVTDHEGHKHSESHTTYEIQTNRINDSDALVSSTLLRDTKGKHNEHKNTKNK